MKLIRHIRDIEGMPMVDKMLLMILATYGKADGSNICPDRVETKSSGIDLLARKLGVHERTIRRSLKRLISVGYLEVGAVTFEPTKSFGYGQFKMYRILL